VVEVENHYVLLLGPDGRIRALFEYFVQTVEQTNKSIFFEKDLVKVENHIQYSI